MSTATTDFVENNIKDPVNDSLDIHSPSKWFQKVAELCGSGFNNGLDSGFSEAFEWFQGLRAKINNNIGSLHSVGWNAIIGMNNGMIEAADQHLYKNAQTIAQNVANIFRSKEDIGRIIRESVKGMAIYADGHLIGYLQEENQQFRNRNGFGLLEG